MKNSGYFQLIKFIGLVVLVFVILFIPSNKTDFHKSFSHGGQSIVEKSFATVGGKGVVKYFKLDPKTWSEYDILAKLVHQDSLKVAMASASKAGMSKVTVKSYEYRYNTVMHILVPWLFFIALTLVSAVHLKRKVIALLLGSVLWALFSWIDYYLRLLNQYQTFNDINLFAKGSIVDNIAIIYPKIAPYRLDLLLLAVFLLWAVLLLRKINFGNFKISI